MIPPPEVVKNTLVDYPRLDSIVEMLHLTRYLPGCNAEVGVYKGGTAYLIAENSIKPLFLFDTFEGMPEVSDKDLHKKGDFADTSFEKVFDLMLDFKEIYILKGIFPPKETFHLPLKYSFVHIDCDIYKSVKDSLEFFYPLMVRGGIICLDDYDEPNCPGAKLAVDEFLRDKPEGIEFRCQSQVAFIKGSSLK